MRPKRWYHGYALFTRAYIRYTQLREVWRWLTPAPGWFMGRDPAERRAVAPDRRTRERWGPDVRVRHVPGQSDAEIVHRLLADLFPARAK
jgi:hypothetical protein